MYICACIIVYLQVCVDIIGQSMMSFPNVPSSLFFETVFFSEFGACGTV